MLLHYNPSEPLYIVGTGVYTYELIEFISQEYESIVLTPVTKEEYFNLPNHAQCMIGFQNMDFRINFLNESRGLKRLWPTYIHSSAVIFKNNQYGQGTVIGPQTFIGHAVVLGDFCSISQMVSVGHGSSLGVNCVATPGTTIGGSTHAGDNVFFGQSSSVRDKITICNDVRFHMTSVVTKSVEAPGSYFGNKKVFVDTSK
jgi:acyl-[acyl carrier protein]--UDP-N-acetylglucosamine O-acyltransferase